MTEATVASDASETRSQAVTAVPAQAHAGIGGMLRARREALGMSIEDIASVLKIAPPKVEAIEVERWEALPTEPYLSGFLRNYAKALRLDAEDLIAKTAETASSPMQTPAPVSTLHVSPSFEAPLMRQPGNRGWLKGPTTIYWIVAAVLLIGSILWSRTQSYHQLRSRVDGLASTPNGSPEAPGLSETVAKSIELGQGSEPASNVGAEAESRNAAASRQASLDPSRAKAQANLSRATLLLQFTGDSWVQVAQADGTILMSKLNSAQTETALSGTPPFNLIIGNAAGAKLQYRGEAVDLSPYIRGNVARLTLK